LPYHNELRELMGRVRAGDAAAAADLVRLYEPAIRRAARLSLNRELQRELDSVDISQSVLGSFFWRVAAGQFETGSESHLMRLLITLARNKVRERARKRRHCSLEDLEPAVADVGPLETMVQRDLVGEFERRLADDELLMWEWRRLDRSWSDIAKVLGRTAIAVRSRYARAIRRIANELGLE
jgi:DNA-directed RNA polymerase specialized sigma24 family protein